MPRATNQPVVTEITKDPILTIFNNNQDTVHQLKAIKVK